MFGLIALFGGLVLQANPSEAYVWRTGQLGCSSVNSADSASHGFWFDNSAAYGVSQWMRDATYYARQYSYDPTDINTFDVPALAFDTDVVVYDWDIPYTWCGYHFHTPGMGGDLKVGLSQCVSLATNPANACEKFEIDYDESWTNAVSVWHRIALACHEIGHTLGMQHEQAAWSTSCMVDPIDPTRNTLTAENRSWINFLY